jgi:hypothetical protein
VALPPKLAVTVDIHDRQFGADFVAKLFSEPQHEISIQNRTPNHNIDSKARVDGFDYFKFQFSADFVAKLDDKPLARNNRIVAHKCLNLTFRVGVCS